MPIVFLWEFTVHIPICDIWFLVGKFNEAADAAEASWKITRAIRGEQHYESLMARGRLAMTLYEKGDYAGAEPMYRDLIEVQQKKFGKQHPEVAMLMSDLAMMLQLKGDLNGAESMHR